MDAEPFKVVRKALPYWVIDAKGALRLVRLPLLADGSAGPLFSAMCVRIQRKLHWTIAVCTRGSRTVRGYRPG